LKLCDSLKIGEWVVYRWETVPDATVYSFDFLPPMTSVGI